VYWDKGEVSEPLSNFDSNTHKRYILKHCIAIVFILQKNHINPRAVIRELNNKLYNYPFIVPFDIFVNRKSTDVQLLSKDRTAKT
jgi:hypothetical protein